MNDLPCSKQVRSPALWFRSDPIWHYGRNPVRGLFRPTMDVPGGSDGKASAYYAGDLGSIPGSGRSPEEGNGNSLQYSCLENPMDGRAW